MQLWVKREALSKWTGGLFLPHEDWVTTVTAVASTEFNGANCGTQIRGPLSAKIDRIGVGRMYSIASPRICGNSLQPFNPRHGVSAKSISSFHPEEARVTRWFKLWPAIGGAGENLVEISGLAFEMHERT